MNNYFYDWKILTYFRKEYYILKKIWKKCKCHKNPTIVFHEVRVSEPGNEGNLDVRISFKVVSKEVKDYIISTFLKEYGSFEINHASMVFKIFGKYFFKIITGEDKVIAIPLSPLEINSKKRKKRLKILFKIFPSLTVGIIITIFQFCCNRYPTIENKLNIENRYVYESITEPENFLKTFEDIHSSLEKDKRTYFRNIEVHKHEYQED